MNRPEYILNEINKGIKMGMDSISSIAEKVTDDQLKDDLQSEYNQYNTIYIASINGLGEFDNGKLSGWMYTLNGVHPNLGVAQQYLNEGDVIGTVGDTALAECADEPHLHFGFFVEELPVDPGEHVELAAN